MDMYQGLQHLLAVAIVASLVFPNVGCTRLLSTSNASSHEEPCSIYLLDIGKEFSVPHEPACDIEDPAGYVAAARRSASNWLPQYGHHHSYDQHEGPWFMSQAIQNHPNRTNNITEACLVYVDFHCYNHWWLAVEHTPAGTDRSQFGQPGEYLWRMMESLVATEHYKANYYKYIFFWSFPEIFRKNNRRVCSLFARSIQVVCERRALCTDERRSEEQLELVERHQGILAPYNSNMDASSTLLANPKPARNLLVVYAGSSIPPNSDLKRFPAGRLLRHAVLTELQKHNASNDIIVHRACWGCKNQMPHDTLAKHLSRSKFCVVMPGITQSSKRATEVIIHGCLPVFIGPPFNTAPLHQYIDYHNFSIFFVINDTSIWNFDAPKRRQTEEWTLPFPIEDIAYKLHSVSDIVPTLRNFTQADIDKRQRAMQAYQSSPLYSTHFNQSGPTAVDYIIRRAQILASSAAGEDRAMTSFVDGLDDLVREIKHNIDSYH